MNEISKQLGRRATGGASTAEPECADDWRDAYPEVLKERENELLLRRRAGAQVKAARGFQAGVGLSGGGIRSATFALGFFQALARAKLIGRIDYLSTVSGGGYFGGFLGALFRRKNVDGVEHVQAVLTGEKEPCVVRFLRENGRYLAPAGSDDLLLGAAVLFRNWIAIQLVIVTSLLTLFMALQLATTALWPDAARAFVSEGWRRLLRGQVDLTKYQVAEPSPWLAAPAVIAACVVVPLAWSYWTLDLRKVDPGIRWVRRPSAALWTALPHLVVGVMGWLLMRSDHPQLGGWLLSISVLALATALAVLTELRGAIAVLYGAAFAVYAYGQSDWAASGALVFANTFAWPWLASILGERGLTVSAVLGSLLLGYMVVRSTPRRESGYVAEELNQDLHGRHDVSAALKNALVWTAGLLALGLIDSAARSLDAIRLSPTTQAAAGGGLALVAAGLSAWARRAARLFDATRGAFRLGMTASGLAWVVAIVVLCAVLVLVDLAAGRLTGAFQAEPVVADDAWPILAASIALSIVLGASRGLLNRSSQHALYAARLTRAYLGASNHERRDVADAGAHGKPAKSAATRVMPHDDIPTAEYFDWPCDEPPATRHPLDKGAPLHLVNVTINETVDGRSQIQQADRKGLGMALGPGGLSAGIRHHAVFNRCGRLDVYPETGWRIFDDVKSPPKGVAPAASPRSWWQTAMYASHAAYVRLAQRLKNLWDALNRVDPRRFPRERLSIGQWLGISGAAFSTGLGARTNTGLSILAGLANIRLGYWWRHGALRPMSLARGLGTAFWVQTYLYRELLARFPGTANSLWYLSDGGHFENLGGYELVRRRVPFMLLVDAEADPDGRLEGLANFIRKARIDFGAEIEFLDDPEALLMGSPPHVGRLADLQRGDWKDSTLARPDRSGVSRAHAALARVKYRDGSAEDSVLLYVKPTLVGGEPADLAHYHHANPAFPHEPTTDQFFDEAQWESYRKLGELIGTRLFPEAGGPLASLFDGSHRVLMRIHDEPKQTVPERIRALDNQ